jgi:anti-anti-sigma factor
VTDVPLQIDDVDGVHVVRGEIDAHTCTMLDEVLDDGAAVTRVDLSDVTFMDSSGLRILVRHHQQRQRVAGRLEIVRPSRPVQRLFEISGLSGQLNVVSA